MYFAIEMNEYVCVFSGGRTNERTNLGAYVLANKAASGARPVSINKSTHLSA